MNQSFDIILASNSPRRKQLLDMIGLKFTVVPSHIHEDLTLDLDPIEFVQYYAKEKAEEIMHQYPDHLIIGADTIVVINNKILGKPKNRIESFNMLKLLSGQTHVVYTGVSLIHLNRKITETFFESTQVTFHPLDDQDIYYYINNFNTLDKAGSYGIQDWFSVCISKIHGCFYNVMGFPLAKFYSYYKKYV